MTKPLLLARHRAPLLFVLTALAWSHSVHADPEMWAGKLAQMKTHVTSLVAPASHLHWPQNHERSAAEIWYVASRKPLDKNQVIYCVAPRIEIPGPRTQVPEFWTTPFTVQLLRESNQALLAEAQVPIPIEVGASREIASSGPWCLTLAANLPAPKLILKTVHRAASVQFPPRP